MTNVTTRSGILAATVVVACGHGLLANVATKTWMGPPPGTSTSPTDGNWGDLANWSPAGVPALADTISIAGGTIRVNSPTEAVGTGAISFDSGLGNAVLSAGVSFTTARNLLLNDNNGTFAMDVSGGQTMTLIGMISNPGPSAGFGTQFGKTGSGTLVLDNPANNFALNGSYYRGGTLRTTASGGTPLDGGYPTYSNIRVELAPSGSGTNVTLGVGATGAMFVDDSVVVALNRGAQTSLNVTLGALNLLSGNSSLVLAPSDGAAALGGATAKLFVNGESASSTHYQGPGLVLQSTDSTGDYADYDLTNGIILTTQNTNLTNGATTTSAGGEYYNLPTGTAMVNVGAAAPSAFRVGPGASLNLGTNLTASSGTQGIILNGGTLGMAAGTNPVISQTTAGLVIYTSSAGGTVVPVLVSNGGLLAKIGPGDLRLRNGANYGPSATTSGFVTVSAGRLILEADSQLGDLSILSGSAVRLPTPATFGTTRTVTTGALKIETDSGAQLILSKSTGAVITGAINNVVGVNVAGVDGVRAVLQSGYAGGAWTGGGIVAGTAAAGQGVGYLPAAVYQALHSTNTFQGVTLSGTEVVLRFTYFGDTQLNGTVSAVDFAQMDAAYLKGMTNAHWQNGDFNYDGVVDVNDFALATAGYNAYTGGGGALAAAFTARFGAAFTTAYQAALAPVATPEPASLALLGLGAVALRRRRR